MTKQELIYSLEDYIEQAEEYLNNDKSQKDKWTIVLEERKHILYFIKKLYEPKQPKTIFDRIKAMSVEDFADWYIIENLRKLNLSSDTIEQARQTTIEYLKSEANNENN